MLENLKDSFPGDFALSGFKAVDARETYFQFFALRGDGSKRTCS